MLSPIWPSLSQDSHPLCQKRVATPPTVDASPVLVVPTTDNFRNNFREAVTLCYRFLAFTRPTLSCTVPRHNHSLDLPSIPSVTSPRCGGPGKNGIRLPRSESRLRRNYFLTTLLFTLTTFHARPHIYVIPPDVSILSPSPSSDSGSSPPPCD